MFPWPNKIGQTLCAFTMILLWNPVNFSWVLDLGCTGWMGSMKRKLLLSRKFQVKDSVHSCVLHRPLARIFCLGPGNIHKCWIVIASWKTRFFLLLSIEIVQRARKPIRTFLPTDQWFFRCCWWIKWSSRRTLFTKQEQEKKPQILSASKWGGKPQATWLFALLIACRPRETIEREKESRIQTRKWTSSIIKLNIPSVQAAKNLLVRSQVSSILF